MPKAKIREVEGGGIYYCCPSDGTGLYDVPDKFAVEVYRETAAEQCVQIIFRCDHCRKRHSFTIIGKAP